MIKLHRGIVSRVEPCTQEDIDGIRTLWEESDMTNAELAAVLGCDTTSAYKLARAIGLPPRKQGRPIGSLSGPRDGPKTTVDQREPIVRLRKKGMTLAAIGKVFGITREAVRQICDGNGVYGRGKAES